MLFIAYILQVHLSDAGGMAILSQLIWMSAYQQLETPPPTPQVPLRSSPPVRTFVPKVVVKGEAPVPRLSNPFDWTVVSKGRKVRLCILYVCFRVFEMEDFS